MTLLVESSDSQNRPQNNLWYVEWDIIPYCTTWQYSS